MPDMTMCFNRKCPEWERCYRAQARPNPRGQSMSFFPGPPCEYFIPLEENHAVERRDEELRYNGGGKKAAAKGGLDPL